MNKREQLIDNAVQLAKLANSGIENDSTLDEPIIDVLRCMVNRMVNELRDHIVNTTTDEKK